MMVGPSRVPRGEHGMEMWHRVVLIVFPAETVWNLSAECVGEIDVDHGVRDALCARKGELRT